MIYRNIKYKLDIIVVILFSPLVLFVLALCAILIKLDSPGPVIFKQTRVGFNEKPFTCYKLRTMVVGSPQIATHLVTPSSLTLVGQWLRRLKLDELPQLWNILIGQMSLVGPRPCLPSQTQLIAERRDRGVLLLRPGVTGVAQVAGIDMSEPLKLAKIDASYLSTMSFRVDVGLIIATLAGAGRGDRVRAG